MPNPSRTTRDGQFSIVHVETLDDGNIKCLSAMVYDGGDSRLVAFYEARVSQSAADGSDPRYVSLDAAMRGLANVCHGTTLIAFEVKAVRDFIKAACLASGVNYPFVDGNDIDVKVLANRQIGPLADGAAGLRQAAARLGIRTLPADDAPSWGAVASWYILRRLAKV